MTGTARALTPLDVSRIRADFPILHTTAYAFYVGIARLEVEERRVRLVTWERVPLRERV